MAFAIASSAASVQAEETRALCPQLAQLDLATLGTLTFDVDAARRQLGAKASPDLGGADIVLRFYTESSGGRDSIDSTLAKAVRDRAAWHVTRGGVSGLQGKATMQFVLSDRDAAALDAALVDPCLAHEPDFAPRTLPIMGGRHETCYDGATFYLQIERAGGVRTIRHDCQPRWRAGEIMLLLRNATP